MSIPFYERVSFLLFDLVNLLEYAWQGAVDEVRGELEVDPREEIPGGEPDKREEQLPQEGTCIHWRKESGLEPSQTCAGVQAEPPTSQATPGLQIRKDHDNQEHRWRNLFLYM